MKPAELAVRALFRDRRSRRPAVFTAIFVAITTALVVLLSSLPHAVDARSERSTWQRGSVPAPSGVRSLPSTDLVRGQPIHRLDVAGEVSPEDRTRLPDSGAALLSPRLVELAHALPRDQLAERYPGNYRVLEPRDLRFPEQLVAVVGHRPGALDGMPAPAPSADPEVGSPAEVAASEQRGPLELLALIGIASLVVLSLLLVGSVARWRAAHRRYRLAALRLSGATPRQEVGTVAVEAALTAASGALAGILLCWPLRFLAMRVPWGGGTWFASDFAPSSEVVVAAGIGVPLLAVCAALFGLRSESAGSRVGVRREDSRLRPAPRRHRVLAVVSTIVVATGLCAFAFLSAVRGKYFVALAVVFGTILVSASIIGPRLVSAMGGASSKPWRGPTILLAGRWWRGDPNGARRSAVAIALVVFVGSSAVTVLSGAEPVPNGASPFKDDILHVDVPAARAEAVRTETENRLERARSDASVAEVRQGALRTGDGGRSAAIAMACEEVARMARSAVGSCDGPPAIRTASPISPSPSGLAFEPRGAGGSAVPVRGEVEVSPGPRGDVPDGVLIDPALLPRTNGSGTVTLAVDPTTVADRDRARSALAAAAPGSSVTSGEQRSDERRQLFSDPLRITVFGSTAASALAGCVAVITTPSALRARRRTLGALIATGVPLPVLKRALRVEVALPMFVATLGAAAVGVGVGAGVLSARGAEASFSLWILLTLASGVVMTALAALVRGTTLRHGGAEPGGQSSRPPAT